jgi:2,3-bisphosphoglycerate-dependent phosphoglycerate mutase
MAYLVVIRHGITEYNQQKRFTGFTDVSISEQGKEQAKKVGQTLLAKNITFTRAYTSWLKRAWETLDIVLNELQQTQLPVTKHPFLNERHYGDLQGRQHEDMAKEFGDEQVHIWRRSYSIRPPNGECLADVVVRTGFYLNSEIMPRLLAGENVLVCAHGNSNRSILKQLEKVSDDEIVGKEIAYDEPIIYEVRSASEIVRVL